MKKKTLANLVLLSGMIVGFSSICAIDYACKKRPDEKKKPKPYIIKYLPWLEKQNFEDLEIISHDGLKLKAKF